MVSSVTAVAVVAFAAALQGGAVAAPPPSFPVLVDLFKATDGQGWSNSTGWLSPQSVCSW
jgi:hypothetical protein